MLNVDILSQCTQSSAISTLAVTKPVVQNVNKKLSRQSLDTREK